MRSRKTIAYAHSRGVIHRDLKGQNVILGDFGEVVVLDWGLAKLVGQTDEAIPMPTVNVNHDACGEVNLTVNGDTLGTPAYMAPEQAAGHLDLIDHRTDVYGLGAMLYHLLAGQPPFEGATVEEVLRKVQSEEPIAARLDGRTVWIICQRLLQPTGRFRRRSLSLDVGMKVRVVSHDPNWSAEFVTEAERIRSVLGGAAVAVHHIGSTAIPGIWAKPVIDILLEVDAIEALEAHSSAMVGLGYEAKGEFGIPGRHYFRMESAAGVRTHQIHAFETGSADCFTCQQCWRAYRSCRVARGARSTRPAAASGALSSDPPLSVPRACTLAFPEVQGRFPKIHHWLVHGVHLRNLVVADYPPKYPAGGPNRGPPRTR